MSFGLWCSEKELPGRRVGLRVERFEVKSLGSESVQRAQQQALASKASPFYPVNRVHTYPASL
jgi:hypothetical protein